MAKRATSLVIALLLVLAAGCTAATAQTTAPHKKQTAFTDVNTDTAVGRAILELTDRGVISGVGEDLFEPDAPIAASDYVIMLAKLRSLPSVPDDGSEIDGYMQAALNAHWYDWDQLPPDNPACYAEPLDRELAANILVAAFFGSVSYEWSVHEQVTDFDEVGGRYYSGVLGGLTLGLFDHAPGTPFYPLRDLSRGDACLWAANALAKSETGPPASDDPKPTATTAPTVASQSPQPSPVQTSAPALTATGGVSANGWLQVKGTQLCSASGEPVVLHGMSSMGIQWYPQYTNRQCISNTVARGANIFRIAMYTEAGGYLSDKTKFRALVEEIVQNAIDCDVYVIIDWHILSDGNPMTHIDEAAVFFDEMSQRYADVPNVIYEICNEPNGNITWAADVKPYAERIISVIRKNSPRGIILVGNPMWDQDVDIAAADPVQADNIMYTLHFYAGTHHQALRDKATRALDMGAPIFVSEWGTSAADGSGGVFLDSSDEWLEYMKDHQISWCNWSLCDKNETSAALVPGAPYDTEWTEADLSASGQYVFARFRYGVAETPPSASTAPAPIVVPVTAQDAQNQYGAHHPNSRILIYRENTALSGDEIVSTGCRAVAESESTDQVEAEAGIVVYGDVLGTGEITLSQLVRMAQALTGSRPLQGLYLAAADITKDGGITITDLVLEANLLTDGGTLSCSFVSSEPA